MALKSFADGRIFGRTFGTGEARVVALHGWGRTGSDFEAVLAGFDALALDLPGFGASGPPDGIWGAAGYAEAIGPVLDALAPAPILVGHSFGGRVAVAVAGAGRPLGGIVLTGAPLVQLRSPVEPSLGFRVVRTAHRLGVISDVRMEALRRRRGSADYRAATGIMRDVLVRTVNETYEDSLRRISCPVRLVWGADDTEVPSTIAARAMDILADAGVDVSLVVVEGAGHHLPLERPAALRAAIEELAGW